MADALEVGLLGARAPREPLRPQLQELEQTRHLRPAATIAVYPRDQLGGMRDRVALARKPARLAYDPAQVDIARSPRPRLRITDGLACTRDPNRLACPPFPRRPVGHAAGPSHRCRWKKASTSSDVKRT